MSLHDGGDSRPGRLRVKIHENVIETGRDESHDRDEPSRSAGCAWGHAEPFIESVGGAKGSQGDSIRMDG